MVARIARSRDTARRRASSARERACGLRGFDAARSIDHAVPAAGCADSRIVVEHRSTEGGGVMAKARAAANSVYRVTELIGTSTTSWEDAARKAVETASRTLRDLRVAEVAQLDMVVEGGKVAAYRAKVKLSFKYES
jgi:flavin-binding protein dodecin